MLHSGEWGIVGEGSVAHYITPSIWCGTLLWFKFATFSGSSLQLEPFVQRSRNNEKEVLFGKR
jgi:hypothetical protein